MIKLTLKIMKNKIRNIYLFNTAPTKSKNKQKSTQLLIVKI